MDAPQEFTPEMLEHNDGWKATLTCSILIVLAALVVALRFWSRYIKSMPLGVDDWLILVALPLKWMNLVFSILSVKNGGVGRYMAVVVAEDPEQISNALLYLFIIEFSYGAALTMVKISILFLYYRVFPTRFMKRACYAVGTLCMLWWLAVILVTVLQCQPLHKMWHPFMKEGHCIDQNRFFVGNAVPNVLLDVLILALPIVEVKRLQMRRSLKLSILGIFALGGGVVIFSCVRLKLLVYVLEQGPKGDLTFLLTWLIIWTNLEAVMALICACLPTMQPVLGFTFGRFGWFNLSKTEASSTKKTDLITIGGTGSIPLKSKTETSASRDGPFRRLHDNDSAEETLWVEMDHQDDDTKGASRMNTQEHSDRMP